MKNFQIFEKPITFQEETRKRKWSDFVVTITIAILYSDTLESRIVNAANFQKNPKKRCFLTPRNSNRHFCLELKLFVVTHHNGRTRSPTDLDFSLTSTTGFFDTPNFGHFIFRDDFWYLETEKYFSWKTPPEKKHHASRRPYIPFSVFRLKLLLRNLFFSFWSQKNTHSTTFWKLRYLSSLLHIWGLIKKFLNFCGENIWKESNGSAQQDLQGGGSPDGRWYIPDRPPFPQKKASSKMTTWTDFSSQKSAPEESEVN